ncbi:MAG TPA: DUF6077 domain-containing protein [Rubrobacter sp.]|nr:DUF6077 domain-containing protein [Rubrobacter sp.]
MKTKLILRIAWPEALVVLSSAGALFVLGLLRGGLEAFPGVLFVAVLVLFMAPGLLVSHWLFGDLFPAAASLPVAFVVSTGLFGLSGIPMLFLHTSLDAYLLLAAAILAVFLTVALVMVLAGRTGNGKDDTANAAGDGWLWVPFLLMCSVLAYISRLRVPHSYNDIWVYLAYVREALNTHHLALHEPYFGHETGMSRVKINGWLLEQAAFSRTSGVDPIELVLRYLDPTLILLALLAFYALARVLLKSAQAALLAGCLYALFFLINLRPSIYAFGGEFISRIGEDKFAARFLFLPVALCLAFAYLEYRKLRYLAVFAFVCWAVVAVHPVGLALISLCVAGFGFAHLAVNLRKKEAWDGVLSLAAALLSVILAPALYVLITGNSLTALLTSADINAHDPEVLANVVFARPGWEHILPLGEHYYIMHPSLLLNPVIMFALLVGIPFLLWRLKRSLPAQMLAGALLIVAAVCYVPPLATFVGDFVVLPGQLWRLAWPIPPMALLTLGWISYESMKTAESGLRERGTPQYLIRFLPLALVGVLMALAAPTTLAGAREVSATNEVPQTESFPLDPVFRWIGENVKEPSVLFAPDLENTVIPAYSANANVVSLRGALILDILPALKERVPGGVELPMGAMNVHTFFTGPSLQEGMRILRYYNADYVLVHANSTRDRQLQHLPGFTHLDTPSERYSLYAVHREKLPDS